MANAVCTQCAKTVGWSASRCSRLADLRCPACGGALRAVQGTSPRPSTKGKHYVTCAVCRRRVLADRARTLTSPARTRYSWGPTAAGTLLPAGAVMHSWHEVDPA